MPSKEQEVILLLPWCAFISLCLFTGWFAPESNMTQRYWLGTLCPQDNVPAVQVTEGGEKILTLAQAMHCFIHNSVFVIHQLSRSKGQLARIEDCPAQHLRVEPETGLFVPVNMAVWFVTDFRSPGQKWRKDMSALYTPSTVLSPQGFCAPYSVLRLDLWSSQDKHCHPIFKMEKSKFPELSQTIIAEDRKHHVSWRQGQEKYWTIWWTT